MLQPASLAHGGDIRADSWSVSRWETKSIQSLDSQLSRNVTMQ